MLYPNEYKLPPEIVHELNKIREKEITPRRERNIIKTLQKIVLVGQFLGLFPISYESSTGFDFKWKSLRVLYAFIAMILMGIFATITFFYLFLQPTYGVDNILAVTFYLIAFSTVLLNFRLGIFWPGLMKEWYNLDKKLTQVYGYPKKLNKLVLQIMVLFGVLICVDHTLSNVRMYLFLTADQHLELTIQTFEEGAFPFLYYFIKFDYFTCILSFYVRLLATFLWIYNDVFLIIVSCCVSLRFRQVTKRIAFLRIKFQPTQVWMHVREDYNSLVQLCKNLDDKISFLILLSYSANIFFLLLQLYNSLQKREILIEKIYFYFSFFFTILRATLVSLYCAWINDESKGPIGMLNSIPSSSFNIEIRRLLFQICFDNVALSGCNMFKITRGIILSIASSVVTYELVLIQFNNSIGNKINNSTTT